MNIYVVKGNKESTKKEKTILYYGINEKNLKRILIISGGHLDTKTNRVDIYSSINGRYLMSVKCFHEIAEPLKADIVYICK